MVKLQVPLKEIMTMGEEAAGEVSRMPGEAINGDKATD
jgi:hypothetical protein